jgi:exopolysaccharide biosynthesis polyprenyl glycosylphosphotransferase
MSVGLPHAGRDLATADEPPAFATERVASAPIAARSVAAAEVVAPVELAPVERRVNPLLGLLGASPKIVMATVDLLCTVTAWLGGYVLLRRLGYRPQPYGRGDMLLLVAGAAVIHPIVFVRCRLYLSRFVGRSVDEFRRIVHATALGAMGVAVFAFATKTPLGRSWALIAVTGLGLMLTVERLLVRSGFKRLRERGRLLRSVVVVGSNSEGLALCQMFEQDPNLGYRVVGLVDDEPMGDARPLVLGPVERTLDIVRQARASGVVVAASALDLASTNRLVRELTEAGIHVELSSSLRDIASNRLIMRPLGRFPVVYVEPVRRGGWRSYAKRSFDLSIASVALVAAAPVLFICALAIKLDSPGPVVFKQERVGRNGRRFKVLKLRTMVVDAEAKLESIAHLNEADGPLFKVKDDPRITRVGRFLRKTSLDELPQLVNVLRNEMSMVGPRPALPREVLEWDEELRNRLRVRPGITGMWQVNGRSDTTFEDYQRLDLYYVDNWSLVTDVLIVLKTIPAVLFSRGAH